ncbi:MAG: hypothetical protein R2749_09315 [Acidimicrobiales bacterium]
MEDREDAPEYERRFLVAQLPGDAYEPRVIRDRFIRGTRLRLRAVTDRATGEVLQRKAGHKVRPDGDPTSLLHTSLYLDLDEYEILRTLEADEVVKTRYRWQLESRAAAVDVYNGRLSGLIIAELSFEAPDELRRFVSRPPLGREITHVAELTGPDLARIGPIASPNCWASPRSQPATTATPTLRRSVCLPRPEPSLRRPDVPAAGVSCPSPPALSACSLQTNRYADHRTAGETSEP